MKKLFGVFFTICAIFQIILLFFTNVLPDFIVWAPAIIFGVICVIVFEIMICYAVFIER